MNYLFYILALLMNAKSIYATNCPKLGQLSPEVLGGGSGGWEYPTKKELQQVPNYEGKYTKQLSFIKEYLQNLKTISGFNEDKKRKNLKRIEVLEKVYPIFEQFYTILQLLDRCSALKASLDKTLPSYDEDKSKIKRRIKDLKELLLKYPTLHGEILCAIEELPMKDPCRIVLCNEYQTFEKFAEICLAA